MNDEQIEQIRDEIREMNQELQEFNKTLKSLLDTINAIKEAAEKQNVCPECESPYSYGKGSILLGDFCGKCGKKRA